MYSAVPWDLASFLKVPVFVLFFCKKKGGGYLVFLPVPSVSVWRVKTLVPILPGCQSCLSGERLFPSLFQVVGSDFYGSVEIISFPWSPSSKECRGSCVPGSLGLLGIRGETSCFPFPRDLSFRKTASMKGFSNVLVFPLFSCPSGSFKSPGIY